MAGSPCTSQAAVGRCITHTSACPGPSRALACNVSYSSVTLNTRHFPTVAGSPGTVHESKGGAWTLVQHYVSIGLHVSALTADVQWMRSDA